LAIAYRVYPGVSRAATGLPLANDKYRLSEVCLRSFVESLGPLRVRIWAVLDGCPRKYEDLFYKYFDPADLTLIRLTGAGNRSTFSKQIDILLGQEDSDLVYFAEDDYFYLPGQFPRLLEFMTGHADVDFVSPYDHLDCYTLPLHRTRKWLRVSASHHWRTAASTCLTFLTRKQTLAQCESVFRTYSKSNDDCALWLSLTKQRVFNPFALTEYLIRGSFGWKNILKSWLYGWRHILFRRKVKLWVPIPSIATHLSSDVLAPSIDWRVLIQRSAETSPAAQISRPGSSRAETRSQPVL
jgi:hypothetical protein